MRKLAFVFAFIGSLITIRLIAAPSSRAISEVMEFKLANSDQWVEENEVDDEKSDHDHYLFADDDTIDLNLLREDSDWSKDLSAKGKDAFVADIVKGQNIINNLFSVGETIVLDSKLDRERDVSVLTLHTKQHLPDGDYERVAKYYLAMGQTLQAELRWKSSADASAVKKARKSFEDGTWKLAGVSEASR